MGLFDSQLKTIQNTLLFRTQTQYLKQSSFIVCIDLLWYYFCNYFILLGGIYLIFGYARVSTEDQHLDMQIDALNKYGVERIFQEK